MKDFAGDGVLFKDGDPYRGIGVNCFDAFARTLADPNDTSHGVGLIPSLFWCIPMVPDLVGEPCDQWGNPAGETHEFMRTYVREVVTRYVDSPALPPGCIRERGREILQGNSPRCRPATIPSRRIR